MEAAERGVNGSTSVFISCAAKHDIDVQDKDDGTLRLEFGAVNDIRKKLRETSSCGQPRTRCLVQDE
jgi:hypothetical protein